MTFAPCCSTWASWSVSEATTISSLRDGVPEILNIQPRGSQAKPYQVKQVRAVIVAHRLAEEPEAEPPAEDAPAGEADRPRPDGGEGDQ